MLVTAPINQLVTGYPVCERRCCYCKGDLREGDSVSAYVVRYAGDEHWSIPRLYCRECRSDEFTSMTLGAVELLVDGTLVTTTDVTRQQTSVALYDIEPIIRSAPEEGDAVL
jgi:hypothetical protein